MAKPYQILLAADRRFNVIMSSVGSAKSRYDVLGLNLRWLNRVSNSIIRLNPRYRDYKLKFKMVFSVLRFNVIFSIKIED
jgi:hypothetical protein